jgi:hypothetical protein
MDINQIWPTVAIIIAALATLIGGAIGGLNGVVKVWTTQLQVKAQARADFQLMKENAKLATQAAEQLGKTNEERAAIALQLQTRWNTMAGVTLPADKDLNEANVPTVVKVQMMPSEPTLDQTLPPKG